MIRIDNFSKQPIFLEAGREEDIAPMLCVNIQPKGHANVKGNITRISVCDTSDSWDEPDKEIASLKKRIDILEKQIKDHAKIRDYCPHTMK